MGRARAGGPRYSRSGDRRYLDLPVPFFAGRERRLRTKQVWRSRLARPRCYSILLVACLLVAGCNKYQHKKPDPTKGVVTGVVLCADTGKPARFATVALTAVPKEGEKNDQGDPLPAAEVTVTDLEGRFRMEAVDPGRYYAFATLDGYLDPALAVDPDKLQSLGSDRERHLYAIQQWKDNLVTVTVSVHRAAEISISIQRAAEISGTVTFDDGSPAIGMRFELFRKTATGDWATVGLPLMDSWTIQATSDSHGHYAVANLPAGEYRVCTLMPTDTEQAASRVCLGNVYRRKEAKSVKVAAAEIAAGADIEIPMSGLHKVSGTVQALADGHSITHGTVRMLYADDREPARETSLDDNGDYEFDYVPDGKYILTISGAQDDEKKENGPGKGDQQEQTTQSAPARVYADKEMSLNVLNDLGNLNFSLPLATPVAGGALDTPQGAQPTPQ